MNAHIHAERLPDGQILVWEGGVLQPVSRLHALLIAAWLMDSPSPESRARSIAIRRACMQIVPENT